MSSVTLVVYKSCAQLPTMHAHHRCRVAIALSLYCRKMLVMLLLQMRDLHFVRDNRHKRSPVRIIEGLETIAGPSLTALIIESLETVEVLFLFQTWGCHC